MQARVLRSPLLICNTAVGTAVQSATMILYIYILTWTLVRCCTHPTTGVMQPAIAMSAPARRGPTVFTGYRGDIGATAAAFAPGGWFRTGDLATLGARGYLTVVDRRTDMVPADENSIMI